MRVMIDYRREWEPYAAVIGRQWNGKEGDEILINLKTATRFTERNAGLAQCLYDLRFFVRKEFQLSFVRIYSEINSLH